MDRKLQHKHCVGNCLYYLIIGLKHFRPRRLLNTWLCRWRTCTTEGICYAWIWLSGGWRFGDSWKEIPEHGWCLKERTQWILNKFNRTWLSRMFLEFGPIAVSFSRLMLSFCGKGQDHSVARDKIILWQGTRPTGFRPKILPDGEKN